MSTPLKLVTINIEADRHLDAVVNFLKLESPDVVCLQELYETDVSILADLGYQAVFAPLVRMDATNSYGYSKPGLVGLGVLSRPSILASSHHYYSGSSTQLKVFHHPRDFAHAVLLVEIKTAGLPYKIGTLHHTWTSDGQSSPQQLIDTRSLLKYLAHQPNMVLCGDFNAPRGGEVYQLLGQTLTDHVPPAIQTTIDSQLHQRVNFDLVVDYIFTTATNLKSTPQVTHVRTVGGVSDHLALVAQLG
jgi:endonuclease/exonuclease/phosphatase family metal-dependent hydrolase